MITRNCNLKIKRKPVQRRQCNSGWYTCIYSICMSLFVFFMAFSLKPTRAGDIKRCIYLEQSYGKRLETWKHQIGEQSLVAAVQVQRG